MYISIVVVVSIIIFQLSYLIAICAGILVLVQILVCRPLSLPAGIVRARVHAPQSTILDAGLHASARVQVSGVVAIPKYVILLCHADGRILPAWPGNSLCQSKYSSSIVSRSWPEGRRGPSVRSVHS